MADGDNTASGMGMGMIIGLLIVIIVLGAGAFYVFGGRSASGPAAAVSKTATTAGHSVSGDAHVQ